MSTIEICVDANPIFTWKGDQTEVKNILKAVPSAAKFNNISASRFSDECLNNMLKENALVSDPVGQEMQVAGIIWRILKTKTGSAQHPGKFGDYVGAVDFSANIMPTDEGCTIDITATSKYDA